MTELDYISGFWITGNVFLNLFGYAIGPDPLIWLQRVFSPSRENENASVLAKVLTGEITESTYDNQTCPASQVK